LSLVSTPLPSLIGLTDFDTRDYGSLLASSLVPISKGGKASIWWADDASYLYLADPRECVLQYIECGNSFTFTANPLILIVKRVPYAAFWSFTGNIITAIGSGLLTTLTRQATSGEWIGYQILGGAGRGFAMQMVRSNLQFSRIELSFFID
jgi:hypothetical protein